MAATVYIGLAVSSVDDGAIATATFDSVDVTSSAVEAPPPVSSLPTGWLNRDIGSVARAGSAAYDAGVFKIDGSGADIWGTADEFQYAYRTMSGDGTIVARVASVANVDPWTKAGVMMRENLTPGARHASVFVTPGKGIAFQRRISTAGISTHTSGGAGTAPHWVRLDRRGSSFSAFMSTDGVAWTLIGSDTIPMIGDIYVGLPLTSIRDGTAATATVDNVNVTP